MNSRTVTILGADRQPGSRMPALSSLLPAEPMPELVIEDNVPPPMNRKGVRSKARVSMAIMLGEGEVLGVRRIWADGKLIYNVPPPMNRKGVRSKARVALEQLQPGQSVVIPPQMHSASGVRLMARAVRKANPDRAFTTKSERGGVRVWRTE